MNCIYSRYNNKTYRIDDIEWNLHPSDTFERKDGSKISFKEYYETRYNLKVLDDKQPMLVSKLKARDMKKGEKGPRMLLPELCSITGKACGHKVSYHVNMLQWFAVRPDVR